jgi:hypothetical protein
VTTITQADIQNARRFTHDDGYARGEALVLEFARLREAHDARVTELLDANNRFEQRARDAERELDTSNRAHRATGKMLADVGRAVEAVYYAAHWSPDRECDAAKLWTGLRDAVGLTPGKSTELLGEPRDVLTLTVLVDASEAIAAIETAKVKHIRDGMKCGAPHGVGDAKWCRCHAEMGNDFYFLPIDSCLHAETGK